MKNVLILFCLAISISLTSCNDGCDEGNQPTPASFFIEIIDATSGENVFQNGTYTAQQVVVEDANEVAISIRFIENLNVIQVFPPVSNLSGNTLLVKLNNTTTSQTDEISVTYDVSALAGECFTTYNIENILFPNNLSEWVENIHVVKL
ncbi:hypothetical protein NAT47_06935 [Flavobacterium sp. HXWNR69]|uniref:DUF4843 domain-containing protein n=1 Tax=Flavobacterium fragile TaxID=2949085 RepID=A0ABT0THT7_9FLAO|nr:hypothetical protein [Flavobacterium sp. HXWNR69]MCL9770146.1 hypothetical protein [Flavobacterium sp. HXWNR69]